MSGFLNFFGRLATKKHALLDAIAQSPVDNPEWIKYLITERGVDVNFTNAAHHDGRSALELAILKGYAETIQALITALV